MAFEVRNNTGSLFRNDKKDEPDANPKLPDHTGSALIDGTEYWISAWVKESASGKKFFSFAFKQKEEQRERVPGSAKTRIDLDDEIPF